MHQHCCAGKYSPVTHVIFDLDGTILDSESVYEKTIKHVVENHGHEFIIDHVLKIKGRVEGEVAKITVEEFQMDITEEQFLEEYHDFSYELLGDLELMPGAERLIKHLHSNNIPIAVATSSVKNAFEIKSKKFQDLFALFHHIVCGGDDPEVLNGKPAPDIFLLAASKFPAKPDPGECLVFEDSGNGVKGALAAGMQVVMTPDNLVPYEVWKIATMRLDSLNYFIPGVFGLPPFPQEDLSLVFADTKISLVGSMNDVFTMPKNDKSLISDLPTVNESDSEKNGEQEMENVDA